MNCAVKLWHPYSEATKNSDFTQNPPISKYINFPQIKRAKISGPPLGVYVFLISNRSQKSVRGFNVDFFIITTTKDLNLGYLSALSHNSLKGTFDTFEWDFSNYMKVLSHKTSANQSDEIFFTNCGARTLNYMNLSTGQISLLT